MSLVSLGRHNDFATYRARWKLTVEIDPGAAALDAHFAAFEQRPEGFAHLDRFYFGDLIQLHAFPEAGYSTLLTKGMSGYKLQAPSGEGTVGIELAWTLKDDSVTPEAVAALAGAADEIIAGGEAPADNGVYDFDYSAIPGQQGLTCLLVCHRHWLRDGLELVPGDPPGYIMELFALREAEAELADEDITLFSERMLAAGIEPEDLRRRAGL